MREITKSSWKFVLFLLMFQIDNLFAMEFNERTRNQFVSKHRPVIVMGTNDGYINPTATSIMSVKGSTPDDKSIIVLYNELSAENIDMLEKLSDESTTVVTRKIDEEIQERAKEYATSWNILVQERIFYPEIFEKLNADKGFLNKIGLEGPVKYFVHLDSDTLVLRNLFDIFGNISRKCCFASTNLKFVCPERIELIDAKVVGVSGGVLVWDLDELSKQKTSPAFVAEREKAYYSLYNNKHVFAMYEILLKSKQKREIIEKIQRIIKEPDYLDIISKTVFPEFSDIKSFFEKFSKIKMLLEKAELLGATTFKEFWSYLYEVAIEQETTKMDFVIKKAKEEEVYCTTPTEEEVFLRYPVEFLPEQYNFIVKNIFPKIDSTDLKEVSTWKYANEKVTSYTTLLQQHLLIIPNIKDELSDSFNKMVVMHFDGCFKPWTNEFQELAKDNPSLQKIIDIYKIFEEGITDPDSAVDRSKKALDILKEINPEEELQKVKNTND